MMQFFKNIMSAALRRTLIFFCGILVSLVLLEAGIRLGGFILTTMQDYDNWRSVTRKGTYRILCIGESTTQGQYPQTLERFLNERNIGVKFSVIDKGRANLNSLDLLGAIEPQLDEYRPHAVVAMMGINDRQVKYYQQIPEAQAWIFQHCRVYRLGRMLCEHLSKKLNAQGALRSFCASPDPARNVPRFDLLSRTSLPRISTAATENSGNGRTTSSIPSVHQEDEAYVKLGILSLDKGDFQKANDCFQKAIVINPLNSSAYRFQSELRRRQGDNAEARRLLEKAIELNPNDDHLYVALGHLYRRHADFALIEALYRKAITLNPRNPFAYVELGRLYLHVNNDFSRAEQLFIEAMEIAPENAYIPLELGGRYRLRGDFAQAEALFKRALNVDPQNDRTLEALTSLCEMLGRSELASEYAKKIHAASLEDCAPMTIHNYRKLKEILDKKRIKLVCVQYPMRNVEQLRKIFEGSEDVIFVDNEGLFREAVKKEGYAAYFKDMFAGDFGHCTPKGNELLAQNIAEVILREVFNK